MAGPVYFDAFRRIIIQPDNITVSADAVDDTLTLVAGSGISIVANAGSDQLTIVNTGPGAATEWSAILNKPEAAFNIAGDDSTQKAIGFGELVKFTGASNVTVTTDAEGNVTVTGPDLSGYLTAETDPVYTASTWYTTTNNSANWDAAYSWGDHAVAGYLTAVGDDVTIGSIRINTNVIQTVDSNADLELRASGTGAVSVIGNLLVSGILKGDQFQESFTLLQDATGTVTHDCSTGQVFLHTSPDADWTANFTNLNLDSGKGTTVTLLVEQGATAYIPNAVQVGGVGQTVTWQGSASAPTGNANKTDIVSFTILNNSGTYKVYGQLTSFG